MLITRIWQFRSCEVLATDYDAEMPINALVQVRTARASNELLQTGSETKIMALRKVHKCCEASIFVNRMWGEALVAGEQDSQFKRRLELNARQAVPSYWWFK
jgi:hypothetical protein